MRRSKLGSLFCYACRHRWTLEAADDDPRCGKCGAAMVRTMRYDRCVQCGARTMHNNNVARVEYERKAFQDDVVIELHPPAVTKRMNVGCPKCPWLQECVENVFLRRGMALCEAGYVVLAGGQRVTL